GRWVGHDRRAAHGRSAGRARIQAASKPPLASTLQSHGARVGLSKRVVSNARWGTKPLCQTMFAPKGRTTAVTGAAFSLSPLKILAILASFCQNRAALQSLVAHGISAIGKTPLACLIEGSND